MSKLQELKNKLLAFWQKIEPTCSKIANVLRQIGLWIYRLRSVLLAIPVVMAALHLAKKCMSALPDRVGLLILENGGYQWMVNRNTAVMVPLAVTGVCLLMMFCSRKVIYPWLISIFSLLLPIVIYITNVFPA